MLYSAWPLCFGFLVSVLYCSPPLQVAQDALGFLSYVLSRNNARSRNMKCTIQNRTVLFGKDKAKESSVLFLTD